MFQKTIISKYLKTQNKENLIIQWDLFCAHFHNPEIQENIRNSKEEQYQEGFLRDLFVRIFGYTLNPTIGFNLTTEYKNIKDSKKADGAIIIDDNVVGVIELKGTNTTDLGKVEEQAFNYKNNQTGCKYVITSNFEKLRLYTDDSVRFVEFNLFTLKQDDSGQKRLRKNRLINAGKDVQRSWLSACLRTHGCRYRAWLDDGVGNAEQTEKPIVPF